MKSRFEIPAHVQIAVAALLMFVATIILPHQIRIAGRLLLAWNVAVLAFLGMIGYSMVGRSPDEVRAHARRSTGGGQQVLAGTVVICLMSLAAVAFVLYHLRRHQSDFRLQVFLCLLTVFIGWLLLQVIFARYYARYYYRPNNDSAVGSGLRFSGDGAPDYWDFLYFSFAIGTCYATSDTGVESRHLRRTVLLQSLVSFVFYTALIGLLINTIASLF